MAVFDSYIEKVASYAQEIRSQGSPVREFDCSGPPEKLRHGLPMAVGPNANPGIILRGDTFLELGNPEAGSCSILLWTDDPSRVRDGRITLLGPDIPESADASLPFGQVLVVAGEGLTPEDHEKLQQAQHVSDQIEGYMVRSSSANLWSRVSKDVAAKGLDFESLGRALMSLVKSGASGVSAVELLFVTTSKQDVKHLDAVASQVKTLGSEMVKETWKAKGYDLDCDLDCSSCSDRPVCDEIRDVIVAKSEQQTQQEVDAAES
jgi:CO dehydrogenase/acetyl-CoA synthase beta subunit